jgi:hypothetical protein
MTAIVIPNIHPVVLNVLRADQSVRHYTRDRVYAGSYPSGVELPAVRFRFQWSDPLASPTTQWWSFTGQVDCHADTEVDAEGLAGAVLGTLLQMEGATHDKVVVQGVLDWGVQSVEDGEWTPPKPQRIVAVTLTARAA